MATPLVGSPVFHQCTGPERIRTVRWSAALVAVAVLAALGVAVLAAAVVTVVAAAVVTVVATVGYMTVQLAKSAIDLGIVISDSEKSLAFYCGFLGLEHVEDIPMPIAGGGTMHRVHCGDAVLKLVKLTETPPPAVSGGIPGAQGFRYITLIVSNLDEMVAACETADVTVVVPRTEVRPGVTILMVEDPDGNWVEFVENG